MPSTKGQLGPDSRLAVCMAVGSKGEIHGAATGSVVSKPTQICAGSPGMARIIMFTWTARSGTVGDPHGPAKVVGGEGPHGSDNLPG
ncbi:hypothetical protein [Geochorda subterranea]|uniref:Uncharacterized protein n=1 Tax=Geochorda subterranea TaxID=3109564 RepID=A0ABZ1BTV2_9FIRM|nr:hypothetical protein [Limnochorda sp. LNt]WRP16008.1 hypothetical protein VLY81_12915 [Limnochorda sp. LNt]